jgi:hypothetical protein
MQECPDKALKKGDVPVGKPNFFTSPGKKGSYGTIKTTLSELKGAGGMHGEYAYAADPYDRSRTCKGKVSNVTDAPFIPANPPKKGSYGWNKTNIGNKAHGTCGEFEYRSPGCQAHEGSKKKVETPFIPPKTPKKGYNCTSVTKDCVSNHCELNSRALVSSSRNVLLTEIVGAIQVHEISFVCC